MEPPLNPRFEAARPDEEFAAFVAATQRRLLHVGWLLTRNDHRAEELVQDALVRTYVAWPRVRNEDAFAYARRALLNARTDSWRRLRREQLTDEVPDRVVASSFEHEVGERSALVQSLQRLTARERSVVVARYYLDMTEEAVAADLDITVGTVKSTASRALAKLRVAPTSVTATLSEGEPT